nr:MAG TPA: hypothetical protein [Caudoviricetes sp.]
MRQRKQAEQSLLTGEKIREKTEVKQNKIAHKEFLRIKKLLKNIEKNDDLYGVVINRYCLLYAECFEFEKKREKMFEQLCDLQEKEDELIEHEEMTQKEFYGIENSMQKNLIALDRQVQSKRKMLLEIEKENIMTIASALRSVPKKVEKKKNPLMEALNGS